MSTPAGIAGVWLREADPDKGQLPMDKAIAKLRDEITGVMMERHRGGSRELAFVLGKLDEARQWAIAYLESTGAVVIIPRAEILKMATDATETTVTNG